MAQLSFMSILEIFTHIRKLDFDILLIVVDESVWDIYENQLPFAQELQDKEIHFFKALAGEKAKTFFEFEAGIEFFLEKKIHRNCHLIAVGGGATSDYAGFVAANLLRGISWSIIPTTLLAMVDASIGGKVAINSLYGKNLIGAFHKPSMIYLNSSFLHSLPKNQLISGQGEIVKYGFLSENIYEHIINEESIDGLILKCSEYKLKITEEDFLEAGARKHLNFGHTIGHGIEKFYGLFHGHAVLLGMAIIFKIFKREDLFKQLKLMMRKLNITNIEIPWKKNSFDLEKVFSFISKDKKMIDKKNIDLLLIKKLGHSYLYPIELTEFKKLLEQYLEEINRLEL